MPYSRIVPGRLDRRARQGRIFAGDFIGLLPGWSFLVQSDRGLSLTGSVVDSWTDQAGGLVGTSPTGAQKPVVIAGPGTKQAIQSVSGQNSSVAFAYAMPAPDATPAWVYAVFRQDAWSLNGALFGSPGAEFTMRILQFSASPQISLAQEVSLSGGTAVGTYGRMIAFWQLGTDSLRYGAASTTGAATSVGNSSITIFNQLNSLPMRASLCLFGIRTGQPSAPQIALLDAAVASYYGPTVEL